MKEIENKKVEAEQKQEQKIAELIEMKAQKQQEIEQKIVEA